MDDKFGITFGIVTDGENDVMLHKIIDTIELNNIPKDCYQILLVGGNQKDINRQNTVVIPFDQTQTKLPWTTKKKNTITRVAKYENIVYSHDYYGYPNNWYQQIKLFSQNNDWDIYMNRLLFRDRKTRSVDWACTRNYIHYETCTQLFKGQKVYKIAKGLLRMQDLNYGGVIDNRTFLLPYDRPYSKFQIICGTWWVAKRNTMIQYPMDQELTWGMMEDNKFTLDAIHIGNAKLMMDKNNYVYMLKGKPDWQASIRGGGTPPWPNDWD